MSVSTPKRPYYEPPAQKTKRETVKPGKGEAPSLFVALGDAVKAWGKRKRNHG